MCAGLVVLLVAPVAIAQAVGPEEGAAITRTYLVADLLDTGGAAGRGRGGRLPVEGLLALLQTATGPENWRGARPAARAEVLQGDRLEISAPVKVHGEIKDALEALRRRAGGAARLDSELYEVERDFFTKSIEPGLLHGRGPKEQQVAAVFMEGAEKDLRQKKALRRATKDVPNGGRGCYFAHQTSVLYRARLGGPDEYEAVLAGVTLGARAALSADRRSVTLDLEWRQCEVAEVRTETRLHPLTGKEGEVEVPALAETRRRWTLKVEDGSWLATVLPAARKDRVRLLLTQATIVVPEEEQPRKVNP